MSLKSSIAKLLAPYYAHQVAKWRAAPHEFQKRVFETNLAVGRDTLYGKDHGFDKVKTYEDFKKAVPLRDYEGFRDYVEKIKTGEHNVLWKGLPKYFAKTSGTTSGVKYIPVSAEGMPTFISAGRLCFAMHTHASGNADWIKGGMIFIQGSPELNQTGAVPSGRMSGITYNHVPKYLRRNLTPSFQTNIIDDWETKVDRIVEETLQRDMTVIGGIPPWVLMYLERCLEKSGKSTIAEVFPNFQIYPYGGTSISAYKDQFEKIVGKDLVYMEMYNASEGFIAFQDFQGDEGLLLNLDGGIFYEFVPADEIDNPNPTRVGLRDVEIGKNYAIILNTNSGLWGYIIGDTIKFVSKDPYRVIVTGRTKHYISAFGEHVISEEVDESLHTVAHEEGAGVIEFTVAPQVTPRDGSLPYHEWFVEFAKEPADLKAFAAKVDKLMCEKNIYYRDLITGKMLQPLIIRPVPKDGFRTYMKARGKLGGQNKMPRLANHREYADDLIEVLKLRF